ncbi:MAG: hypothetical protein SOY60_04950 [Fusobacterium gastrosuis]|uniref:hypothetical protein n=1 Tax=Fusobacterium gastrosuis TaxID=1755100 RepID=UPI002979A1D2|nr:hypothetical protein [Fusobacteriaceae bacterium]MDY4010993.1 hypothetical protein [Fusobacterium gastrosuis]MDY5713555.1 hypothetical protein [Fusobacterium gastrosuis]
MEEKDKIEKPKRKKRKPDEIIERLKQQLKKAEEDKKQFIQRKGINLWRKIKFIFLDDEDVVDELLSNNDLLEDLKNMIISFLKDRKKEGKKTGEKNEK